MTPGKAAPLATAWKQWCDLVAKHGIAFGHQSRPPAVGSAGYQELRQRLQFFSDRHPITPERLQAVLIALSKGKHLVEAALAWERPAVGASGNLTDRARGAQWRLVMAYGGFDILFDALLPGTDPFSHYAERFKHFTACCELPPYDPLPAPNRQRADLVRWLESEARFGKHSLLTFLNLRDGDAQKVYRWLVNGRPVNSWPRALLLAKALRNITAHGALSASKVKSWGLRSAFEVFTRDLATVATAALRRLAQEPPVTSLLSDAAPCYCDS